MPGSELFAEEIRRTASLADSLVEWYRLWLNP
ncbi:MAG: hypothetical protein N838_07180 [Thiohalocapsa sp. PB-PSB1]|jgi:hypothetical protein|nr:MAG: hypothetical protein N838_07180 [Thiohalocapsa sp. PB-PSB1]